MHVAIISGVIILIVLIIFVACFIKYVQLKCALKRRRRERRAEERREGDLENPNPLQDIAIRVDERPSTRVTEDDVLPPAYEERERSGVRYPPPAYEER